MAGCIVLLGCQTGVVMACEPRTWADGTRCASCCNGDHCDDPSHYDRQHCPHCKGTGWALWTAAGRDDFIAYLKRNPQNTPERIAAALRSYGVAEPMKENGNGKV